MISKYKNISVTKNTENEIGQVLAVNDSLMENLQLFVIRQDKTG